MDIQEIEMKKGIYKAPGGIIRVALEGGEVIERLEITGDFFIHPEEAVEEMERVLVGAVLEKNQLLEMIKDVFDARRIDTHGIEPGDVVEAILRAK